MRTSIDILNYFRRKKQQKKYRKGIAKLEQQIHNLEQEPYKDMYNDLIDVLNNVNKYCALRPTAKVQASHPLQRIGTYNIDSIPRRVMYHYENMYYAEILVRNYDTEDCIHFELNTGDSRYRYQYSKKGLALQPVARILKQVTQMMTSAWYNKIHN